MRIYSKINPDTLLHIVYTLDEMAGERNEIIPPDQFLQCAALELEAGKTFRPHKHIHRPVTHEAYIPQESWVVISGVVQVTYYDLDDSVLVTKFLYPGDVSITLQGGHNYLIHKRGVVIETKTGPYLGQQFDKVFI